MKKQLEKVQKMMDGLGREEGDGDAGGKEAAFEKESDDLEMA